MKIKNHIILASAVMAALLGASCDDVLESGVLAEQSADNAVRLKATIGDGNWNELSRANKDSHNVGALSFSSGDKIVVDAWYLPDGKEELSQVPDFMRRQEMTYDGTKWDYSPLKYWPNNNNDRLAFYAYYLDGYNDNLVISENDPVTGYPVFNFGRVNYINDIMVSPIKYATKPSINGLELPMKHIMAYIKVKARVSPRDGSSNNHQLKIAEIRFNNAPQTATFAGLDSNEDPIWKNISIYKYTVATTGNYVKVKDEDRYIEVAQGKGNYVKTTENGQDKYTKYDVATCIRDANGDYKETERGYYVKDANGNFVEIEDEVGNYTLLDGVYVEVYGAGEYWRGNATSIFSTEEVVLPASGEYVDMPDASHFMFPCSMPYITESEDFGIFVIVKEDVKSDENSVGGQLGTEGYGHFVYPTATLKGGCITTFYLTVGLHGIDNVEVETRPWVGWSGDNVNTGVTFGK